MIKNHIGFSFAKTIVFVGVLLICFSVVMFFSNIIPAIIALAIGLFMATSCYGVEIDLKKGRYREYGQVVGIKSGTWHRLDKLPFLTVMKSREGMQLFSRSNRSTIIPEDKYVVSLLSKTHRRKVVIKKFDEREDALQYASEISSKLEKEIVTYAPVKTRRDRRVLS